MASNRRSLGIISEIRGETDIVELERKRRELEKAMCDEFQEIFERQNDLETRLEHLENSGQGLGSPIRLKSHEDAKFIDLEQKIEATSDSCDRLIKDLITRVEKLENENKRLIAQNHKLKNQIELNDVDDEITRLNRENREIQKEIEKIKSKPNLNSEKTVDFANDRIGKINIEIPKFKGTQHERPIKFINELESYIVIKKVSFNEIKLILSQSLENEAKEWWYINEGDVNSFDEFATLFKDRFWCTTTQRKLKRKIECGQYIVGGKYSRANYATHLFSIAKDLDTEYDDDELIHLISEQYDREIKYTLKSNARNKNDLFKILAEFDNDDKQLREKTREKPQNQNSSNNQHNNSNNFNKFKPSNNNNNNFKRDFKVQTTELTEDTTNKTQNKKVNQNEKGKLDDKSKMASDLYKNIDILAIDLDSGNAQ